MTTIERLRALRRIAREAQNTYVGTHWPSMADMRFDGIGFGLVDDNAHERFIRRYLATFQPDFMVDLIDEMGRLLAVSEAAGVLIDRGAFGHAHHGAERCSAGALAAALARLDGTP